jgi:hypothetical protein
LSVLIVKRSRAGRRADEWAPDEPNVGFLNVWREGDENNSAAYIEWHLRRPNAAPLTLYTNIQLSLSLSVCSVRKVRMYVCMNVPFIHQPTLPLIHAPKIYIHTYTTLYTITVYVQYVRVLVYSTQTYNKLGCFTHHVYKVK